MATVFKRGGKKAKGYWYASWTSHNGKRTTKCTFTTDKATAERIARKNEADAALRRDGVIDPALDATCHESARTIESHLTDYKIKMRAANRDAKHIYSTLAYIRAIAADAGFDQAQDINSDGVTTFAGSLKDAGKSARTIQAYIAAIKAFTRWLASHHKLPRDPLSSVKKPNPKSDRRRERRMLLPEEWRLLEPATETGPERYGMIGAERLLLYRTAIQTGLRANELRSLTRGRLYFDSSPPYIVCKAGSTKNRKDAHQYIQRELAADLKAHIATKAPKAPVFKLPHQSNLARMMRDDLAEARKQWISDAKDDPQEYARRQESDFLADTNDDGEITDFHSLRHTCGAGDDRRTPGSGATSDAAPVHHVDDGHLRPFISWRRSGRGAADAGNARRSARSPPSDRNRQYSSGFLQNRAAPGAARRTRNGANGCEAVRWATEGGSAKGNAHVPTDCGLER